MKTGKTYDGTVLLADTGGKYVNYRVEQRGKTKNSKHRECSHTPGKIPDPAHLPGRGFSLWGSPKPLVSDHHHRKDVNPKCLTAPTTMTI